MIDKIVQPLLNTIKFHKKKIALLGIIYIFFLYWIFPFNDLGDLVAQKVSELTAGQVFVNFDSLDFNIVPHPGIALSRVVVESAFAPKLSAKNLYLSPNIPGLLSFKPGINVHAVNLLGGDVDLATRGGEKTAAGKIKQKINLDLSKVSLQEISDFASLPMKLAGSLSGSIDSQIDLDFIEQPSSEIELTLNKVSMPDSSFNTTMGPMTLPQVNLNDVVLSGKAEKGSIEISKFVIGKPGSDVYANVTGKLDVKLEKLGAGVSPRFGAYDLNVRLQVGEDFKNKMGTYLGLLQSYQNNPNSYAFKISSSSFYGPPNFTRLQ